MKDSSEPIQKKFKPIYQIDGVSAYVRKIAETSGPPVSKQYLFLILEIKDTPVLTLRLSISDPGRILESLPPLQLELD